MCSVLLTFTAAAASPPPLDKLTVPAGYKVSLFAYPVPSARELALGPDGVVFVGARDGGRVYALVPRPGQTAEILTVASGLNMPTGVAYRDGTLYIAELDRLSVIKNVGKVLRHPPQPQAWGPKFPDKTHHGWKFIAFGPDGWLYVPVGAPCNVCLEDETKFAALFKVSPDGKKREVVARGLRNTVGFDWQPGTGALFVTENGRDWLGDDLPPDELNRIDKPGLHFGFPFCHGRNIKDPELNNGRRCAQFTPPAFEFPAHVAPLGFRFLLAKGAEGTALVAQHGSWNRSHPIGYQVARLHVSGARVTASEQFLSGFLDKGSAWGRPVDVLELSDGSVLVSDDTAHAVYRVHRE